MPGLLPPHELKRAAALVDEADALLLTAGAGMGVDSGLPDFRGTEGFWRAYPPFKRLGLGFVDLASPYWFSRDPHLAWGFYGHRLNLYRATAPHDGFRILRRWGESKPGGYFVFTSNVDGQFQKAGFEPDRVVECHGSIHHLQCALPCNDEVWPSEGTQVDVDPETFRARDPLPRCPACGGIARPNVLMFGDGGWIGLRTGAQQGRFESWLESVDEARVAVVECGAGRAVPTVRRTSERVAAGVGAGSGRHAGATLVRVNVREPEVPPGHVGLPLPALEALRAIDAHVGRRQGG